MPDALRLCVRNRSFKASLDVRKVYAVLPDPRARRLGLSRVIDESGEDYLYPTGYFVAI